MGILSQQLVSATDGAKEIYACVATNAALTISVSNVSDMEAGFNLYATAGSAPTDANSLERGVKLLASEGTFERTGLVLGNGQKLFVESTADVAVSVYGYEE